MTQEEFNYIKDSFSQILDDIGGNPDWYDAAKAVASNLGTIERQLEERITKLPSNLDDVAENRVTENGRFEITSFEKMRIDDIMFGAEWMEEQMMKRAIEADVNTYKDLATGKSWAEFVAKMPTNNLSDKVRIIIVKEDKK